MKASEIKVGHTYRNRGKGRTMRTVLAIGAAHQPRSAVLAPRGRVGVQYVRAYASGNVALFAQYLWLESFARWAASEVKDECE
jgi:hypothetical protein